MKNHEIHAAMKKCLSEQNAVALEYGFPELIAYTAKYYDNKPREPARTKPNRTEPKQFDIAYQIGKAIARIIRRVLK